MNQAEVTQPVQKSGSNKTIFIVLAIAIILFICFCCGLFMATMMLVTPTSTTTNDDTFETFGVDENKSEPDNKSVEYLDFDETANFDGLEISITDVDTEYMPEETTYYYLAPDKRYFAVEVFFVNRSDEPVYYSDFDFKMKDSDDYSFLNIYSGAKQPTLSSGTLPTGQMIRGWITYEVPLEDTDLSLVYSGDYGNRSVEFSLR